MLTKDAVKEEAVAQSRQKLQLVDGYVSNMFDYMLYIANTVQHNSEMSMILKEIAAGKEYEGENANYEQYTDRMRIINKIENMTVYGDKAYVTILLTNGTSFTNYSSADFNPNLMKEEPWFGKLDDLKGLESLWIGTTPSVFTEHSSPFQISMARTLRAGVKPYGYVVVTIMEQQVNSIFSRLAEGQETLLLDNSGVVLSHLDSERIGSSFRYGKSSDREIISSDIVNSGEGSYILTRHKQTITGWELVSLTPYKEAVFKLNSIFNRIAILQLVSFVVFLLLFIYLLGSFTRPLVRLGKMAETVKRGNLEVRSNIRGNDEIGYLGHSFDLMLEQIKRMIVEVTQTQTRKRKAELAMLQAQINPHFLFNVLNSIRMKVMRKGDLDSAEMISSLSKLLRMTIIQEKGAIPLHEELSTVTDYVKLMNMRQKEGVELKLELSPDTLMLPVPRFFLQPVIENSLIHGLSQQAGTIVITTWSAQEEFFICVADNGKGMDQPALDNFRIKMEQFDEDAGATKESRRNLSGIGITNVCERMRLAFGESFRIEVDSTQGLGTKITMTIPRQEEVIADV